VKKILVLLFVFLFAFTVYAQEEAPLFEWNGTGMKNTEVFEVKSPWRIVWNVTKEPFACVKSFSALRPRKRLANIIKSPPKFIIYGVSVPRNHKNNTKTNKKLQKCLDNYGNSVVYSE